MSDASDREIHAEIAAEASPRPIRPWVILPYDTHRFPFGPLLMRDVFKVRRLDLLHEYLIARRRSLGLTERLSAKDNLALRAMMQNLPEEAPFNRLYHRFVVTVLLPLVGRGLSYSSHPKMRVHLPGTGSVSSFHHDLPVTRRADQVNLWMPFTDVQDTATLWCESEYGRGDYAAVPVRYGEVLIFDGGYLGHGSKANRSSTTRISLDTRFSFKGGGSRANGVELLNVIIQRLPVWTGDHPARCAADPRTTLRNERGT